MGTGFIITGMAARTIGLIRGELPGNHLRIGSMAIRAIEILTVIARITGGQVGKYVGLPGSR